MKTLAVLLCVFALARTARAQCELEVLDPVSATELARVGYAVAIDGATLLAGAIHDGASREGAVHVFQRGSGGWTETATLRALEPAGGSWFGSALALEGGRALVGADHESFGDLASTGAVYVFDLIEGTWTQTAKLLPEVRQAEARFGISVALAGDTAFVGALEGNGRVDGAVYVFELAEEEWTLEQRLVPASPRAGGWFGLDLAVSAGVLLVGAPSLGSSFDRGRAYLFEHGGEEWSESGILVPPPGFTGQAFGRDVALDGRRILIGASGPGIGPAGPGRAFAFERAIEPGSFWALVDELVPHEDGASNFIVGDVALSGERALVSTPFDDSGAVQAGSVWYYARGPDGWEERGKLVDPSPALTEYCGLAAALAEDGTAVAGVPFDRNGRGSVLVWRTSLAGCASLAGTPERVSVTQGGVQQLLLDSPASAADDVYLVLGSERGSSPGIRLRSDLLIPLNPGSILYLSGRFPNAAPFGNTLGRLDARGAAVATVTIPRFTDPALIGLRLHFAYLSGDGASHLPPRAASNAVSLELVP